MLKLKKIEPQKIILYSVILAVLFGGTIFILYKNRAGQPDISASDIPAAAGPPGVFIGNAPIGGGGLSQEQNISDANITDELGFLSSVKFKKLQDNFSEPATDNPGNKNPFLVPKQTGAGNSARRESGVRQPADE